MFTALLAAAAALVILPVCSALPTMQRNSTGLARLVERDFDPKSHPWDRYQCLFEGVDRSELDRAIMAASDWCNAGNVVTAGSRAVFDDGFTRLWICAHAGDSPCSGEELTFFSEDIITDSCPLPKGGQKYIHNWEKTYGHGSVGYNPCPTLTLVHKQASNEYPDFFDGRINPN